MIVKSQTSENWGYMCASICSAQKNSFYPRNAPFCCSLLSLFPAPWRYWFLLCHYGSMFLSMTYKWNCRICTTSLPQHSAFEIQFSEFAHFSVWVRPVCLSIHPLKNIWIVSALVLLQTKLLWTFFVCLMWRFLQGKCPGGIARSYGKHMFNFKKNLKLSSKAALSSCTLKSMSVF